MFFLRVSIHRCTLYRDTQLSLYELPLPDIPIPIPQLPDFDYSLRLE